MIRRGKKEGWLNLSAAQIPDWASMNNVQLHSVSIEASGDSQKGSSLVAKKSGTGSALNPLMTIPPNVVLCKETVYLHAKSDRVLKEVLDAIGEFGQTPRGAILVFLLLQATYSCPEVSGRKGVAHPFTDYIKFLPLEYLPTFWSVAERAGLHGTSLAPALDAKLASLFREFDLLRSSTENISWCQTCWWTEPNNLITLDDWKQVDAMYRSRALEFPSIGDSMVPCLDMANHEPGANTRAIYDIDEHGSAILLIRHDKMMKGGEEVTITYGDQKGACEMIFSYGFLEAEMASARDIFLDLEIPDDDPLKRAKNAVADCLPGVRLTDSESEFIWESEFVWIICVNEEDGLQFKIAQELNGEQQLQMSWLDRELSEIAQLKDLLRQSPLWDVFQLRAISILQDRVEQQLRSLYSFDTCEEVNSPIDITLMKRLRVLETGLLEKAYEWFEDEKNSLAKSEAVLRFLNQAAADAESEDEFA